MDPFFLNAVVPCPQLPRDMDSLAKGLPEVGSFPAQVPGLPACRLNHGSCFCAEANPEWQVNLMAAFRCSQLHIFCLLLVTSSLEFLLFLFLVRCFSCLMSPYYHVQDGFSSPTNPRWQLQLHIACWTSSTISLPLRCVTFIEELSSLSWSN